MTETDNTPGILVVGHGSPRQQANDAFLAMVSRLAVRLGAPVLPTFFSLARPNIEDQVDRLASQGVRRIVVMPFFLFPGQHVTKDIPALLERCRAKHPDVRFELLSTLDGEPSLEDAVVERLVPYLASRPLPTEGKAIEQRSYEIIESHLGPAGPADPAERAIIRRVIHATADLSFARSMRIHPQAVRCGTEALAAGRPILCDVQMLHVGITRAARAVHCAISDPQTTRLAAERGCTRAAAAMEVLQDRLDGAIVAIGNAPTALWKVLEIAATGGPRPALVVGLPVGFVGARESKLALIESGLCYITNIGPRGGSPVAAAAVNALALLKKEVNDA
jgi:precorrin-8X/cobalt-precorrin-8 methylmutase